MVSAMCLSFFFLMPLMVQPLSLGMCIMVLSGISCIVLGMLMSSWYGYILFLIYVGGLLVMFAYVSALAPNNLFSGKSKLLTNFLLLFPLSMIMLMVLHIPDFNFLTSVDLVSGKKSSISFGGVIVSPSSISLMVFMGVILLINLIAVVKVCYYQHGPLRSHFEM
uniref:NADH-ubiquinone oxidoreductase chain 6 n=1 Tax=Tectus pyramis TaxID=500102 RepID=A0A291C508_9VEST|nr:NADH dehydrogenase subunit 6 [Tectus pyramis]ATF29378.1 NADH dehydrogenase subunit 6 [Tectus pyramis]